jgi:hypothetical protein
MMHRGDVMEDKHEEQPPTIQALGIVQEGYRDRGKASGFVEGLGWLEARGTSMFGAMEALQARVAKILSEKAREEDA